ncbi:MAG: hypothetical protein E7L00_08425 [Propionibacteriaceae bacterium]|nr:hypothetical protein [Propionibacteriaceae bacterium]
MITTAKRPPSNGWHTLADELATARRDLIPTSQLGSHLTKYGPGHSESEAARRVLNARQSKLLHTIVTALIDWETLARNEAARADLLSSKL